MRVKLIFTSVICCLSAPLGWADQVVFGSFRSADNAQNWAKKLSASFALPMNVEPLESDGGTLYRVVSEQLDEASVLRLRRRADAAGIRHWRLRASTDQVQIAVPNERRQPPLGAPRLSPPSPIEEALPTSGQPSNVPTPSIAKQPNDDARHQEVTAGKFDQPIVAAANRNLNERVEWDVGLQSRWFSSQGMQGQDQLQASVSVLLEYYRGWDNDTRSITFAPFLRADSMDSERSHGDIRELFYSQVGNSWDLHIGAKRVFWGVTEFNHLVDIINQTDLVENIDTEDKLGQPMVHLSLVRNWGIVDVFALTGFRERTFAGDDGRLAGPFAIVDDGRYESGAEQHRTDFALRWSHYMGPFEVGLHHFSGTSRDPMLLPELNLAGDVVLAPYYPVIDQTGLDAQAFYGDLAIKLEAFSRSGFGPRYFAANIGLEHTFVGVMGSQADVGLVAEYMFDERADDAFNTFFENDIAIGGRLHLNNFADTKALFGVIADADTDDFFYTLEASTRLADDWLLVLEGRVFNGGHNLRANNALLSITDPDYKSAWLQDEDYLQLELKKFF